MAATLTVPLGADGVADFSVARERFEEETRARLMRRIGLVLLASSQRAFTDQRFGDIDWPARYPFQPPPKLNVAGALADLLVNDSIKGRRFQDRPAGIDEGTLRNSLAPFGGGVIEVAPWAVTVGSTVPYAGRFHAGGESEQRVTQTARDNLAAVLGREGDSPRGVAIRERMGFIFQEDTVTTEVVARPFVGITDEARAEIRELVEEAMGDDGDT